MKKKGPKSLFSERLDSIENDSNDGLLQIG